MQETKYGTEPTEELLKQGMRFDFEHMCMIHDSLLALEVRHFFNLHSCILFISILIILTNVDRLIIDYFYDCR